MLWHWISVVAEEEAGPDGFGRTVQRLAEYFYTDDGLLASMRAVRLQPAFDVLAELSDRVGLQTNAR